jgi:hypothetical protein
MNDGICDHCGEYTDELYDLLPIKIKSPTSKRQLRDGAGATER